MYDIFVGTWALNIPTALVLVYSWIKYLKLERTTLVTFVMVAVFDVLTIYFHNAEFMKGKVRLIYGLCAPRRCL